MGQEANNIDLSCKKSRVRDESNDEGRRRKCCAWIAMCAFRRRRMSEQSNRAVEEMRVSQNVHNLNGRFRSFLSFCGAIRLAHDAPNDHYVFMYIRNVFVMPVS